MIAVRVGAWSCWRIDLLSITKVGKVRWSKPNSNDSHLFDVSQEGGYVRGPMRVSRSKPPGLNGDSPLVDLSQWFGSKHLTRYLGAWTSIQLRRSCQRRTGLLLVRPANNKGKWLCESGPTGCIYGVEFHNDDHPAISELPSKKYFRRPFPSRNLSSFPSNWSSVYGVLFAL